MKTTIVNLFGGPGTGKSTNAALSFGKLKVRGITAEYISEFAKDLVWEERHHALGYQPYLSAKQIYRIQRVIGKVPVIITDSPILLSLIYGQDLGPGYKEHIWEVWDSWNTMNFFLIRDDDKHPYVPLGRTQQTVDEARKVDRNIENFLNYNEVPHATLRIREGEETANILADLIEEHVNE
jgi:hypothetical protein